MREGQLVEALEAVATCPGANWGLCRGQGSKFVVLPDHGQLEGEAESTLRKHEVFNRV